MDILRTKTGNIEVMEKFKHKLDPGETHMCRQWEETWSSYGYFLRDLTNGVVRREYSHSKNRDSVYAEFNELKRGFGY